MRVSEKMIIADLKNQIVKLKKQVKKGDDYKLAIRFLTTRYGNSDNAWFDLHVQVAELEAENANLKIEK